MDKKWMIVAIVAAVAVVTAGAGAAVAFAGGGGSSEEQAVTLTDIEGREVTIRSSDRIVSQSATPTAILCGLGASSKLVGVSSDAGVYDEDPYIIGLDQDDFPNVINEGIDSGRIKALGGMYGMSAETMILADPDLVILDSYGSDPDIKAALDTLGVTYVSVAVDTIDRIYQTIEILGKAVGMESNAETVMSQMRASIKKVTDWCESIVETELNGERYDVAMMMTSTYATGPEYLMGEIASSLCINNVFEELGRYAPVTKESIASKNPDIIVYQSLGMGDEITDVLKYVEQDLPNDALLGAVDAVKNGLVFATKDGAKNAASQGSHGIVRAYATYAMFIYKDHLTFELPHVLDGSNCTEYMKQFWDMINA